MTTETKLCRLQYTAGRVEACPGSACPFWDPGGAVLQGRCSLDGIDLVARADVAHLLLHIRKDLELAETHAEVSSRRLFYRLLETGDSDGG
jgi:hypothetical protein